MTKTFANERNQDIWRAQTQAKTAKVSAPKWKNHNFRKFLIYQCIFWITIEICKESRGSKKILWFLSKKQKQKKNSVCTVSYSMVKVACGDLVSSIYYVHMGVRMGVGKNWHALHFLTITWKIKYQINICIVSWMIRIFKTQTTTALILLYTMK